MTELRPKPTKERVDSFLNSLPDEQRRQDCFSLLELMKKVTGGEPKMWGDSIIGFGDYHYKYASGREGDTFKAGFSPRKQNLTVYLNTYLEYHSDLLGQLGKFKAGKGCLYIKSLEDIDLKILENLITRTLV
jgi:hypothetical protein